MVAFKGRLSARTDHVFKDKGMNTDGAVKNFVIFAEGSKYNETKGKVSQLRRSSCSINIHDSKGDIKDLERSKIKLDKPVKINIGRKVLADISNHKSSSSKSEHGKSSKPRDAGSLGKAKTVSSEKPSRILRESEPVNLSVKQGSVRLGSSKPTTGNRSIKRAVRNTNPTLYESRTTVQDSSTAMSRISSTIPLHLTRKSFPVSKQTFQMEIGVRAKVVKECSDNFEKLRGKHDYPVNPSLRRSFVPKPRKLSGRPVEKMVDGGAVLSSRGQIKPDSRLLARTSVKPIVKTACTIPNNKRNSKSNDYSMSKLRSGPAIFYKKRDGKSSMPEDIPSAPSEELAPKDVISGSTSNTGKTTDNTSVKKYGRRKSYTSSLLSKAKDPLPNIYDTRNPLEVSDYVDDIYQYYWNMEAQNPTLKNYMEIQKDITTQMRGILINWLIEVHLKFDLMEETLFLTVRLLDRYLSLNRIKKNEMQLVGLTALLLASKYEDFWHPRISDLISISSQSYTRDQMLEMEKVMLQKLKFRLNEPTLYVFMLRFLKAAQPDKKLEHLAFYLIELCLVEYEALNYKPSMLCASAIYVARSTLHMTPMWTSLLAKHTRYEDSQIRSCAEMVLKFHREAKTKLMKVTYEKYLNDDYGRTATIKPLDLLSV